MGLSIGFSSDFARSNNPNPNPRKFQILTKQEYPAVTLLRVYYPNCTTYGGEKGVVIRGKWDENRRSLDPHFLPDNDVMARFCADLEGWVLAQAFCQMITAKPQAMGEV